MAYILFRVEWENGLFVWFNLEYLAFVAKNEQHGSDLAMQECSLSHVERM